MLWTINKAELNGLLKAVDVLIPPSSKRKSHQPYAPDILCLLQPHFNLDDPLDAASRSCFTTLFYTTSQGREFTVKNLSAFDPAIHVKRSNITEIVHRNSLKQTDFFLLCTKSDVHRDFAKRNEPSDPETPLTNHFYVNNPPNDAVLFSY
ncbi:hypothetical protein B0H10DRAFT_2233624 [Mycena sp. CBHHK59/15]|nr:hypothetical protein B0H10DRAFT_2233624 [Mycena sp. CBHHK59/15]